MATVSQLVEAISVVTMVEHKTVNYYARALIDGGALPKASGRSVPHVNGEHVVKLLLAIAIQPTIKKASKVVDLYCALEAETNEGTVTALSILSDLFGAASAGGISGKVWNEVSFNVYENRLGIDVRLPASRHSKRSDREIIFRMKREDDFDDIAHFFVSPNRFFSRSANVSFDAVLFVCQLMSARQPQATPQGEEAVKRLLTIRQTEVPEDVYRRLSVFDDTSEQEGAVDE